MKDGQAAHQKDLDAAQPIVDQCVSAIEKIELVNEEALTKLKDKGIVQWDQVKIDQIKTISKCLCVLFGEDVSDVWAENWVTCQ